MELTRSLLWSIVIGSSERQSVFYIDRPSFHFPQIKEERAGKIIILPSPKPEWRPIIIEFPMTLLSNTDNWLSEGGRREIDISCVDKHGSLLESWILKGAIPMYKHVGKSRVIVDKVIVAAVKYEWARKVR